MDWNWVTTRLGTGGGIVTLADVEELVNSGITHIIDCRIEFDDADLLRTHQAMSYLWNGTADDGQPKSPVWFGKSIEFALDAMSHSRARCYIHCFAGVNRGPSTLYAVLLAFGLDERVSEQMIRQA